MHLKCLQDAIAATVQTGSAPRRWFLPALMLFTTALSPLGEGFDVLYANLSGLMWTPIPKYWRTTLRLWADLHATYGQVDWKDHVQTMPFWYNAHFSFGKGKLPLSEVNLKTIGHLKALGFNWLQDVVGNHGSYFTEELLQALLHPADFVRPASRTGLVSDTLKRFNLITPLVEPTYGPCQPAIIEAAYHNWRFENQPVVDMANRDFVKLVLKAHKNSALPQLPLEQLGLTNFIVADDTWTKELYWDNHVLPVCKDLKFRVQHNALGFLYKFHWRTNVASPDQCIHNCSAKENAVHLFWECRVAQFQWDFFLRPFNVLFTQPAVWQMLLFPDTTKILPTAIRLYGEPAVFITFSIIRCCVLRALWLHQNKWLYNLNVSTSSPFVQHHAKAYVRLHLSLFKAKAFTKNNKKWIQMAEYLENQLCLVTTITSVDTTTTTSATTALSPTLSTGILPDPVDPRSPLSAFALESSLQSSSSAGPPSLSIANLGVLERSGS